MFHLTSSFSWEEAKMLLFASLVICNIAMVYFIRKIAAYHPQARYTDYAIIPIPALAKFLISSEVQVDFKMKGYFKSCEVAAEDRDKLSIPAGWLYMILIIVDLIFCSYRDDLIPYVEETVWLAGIIFLLQFWLMYFLHAIRNCNNGSVFGYSVPKNRMLILQAITISLLSYIMLGFQLWIYWFRPY